MSRALTEEEFLSWKSHPVTQGVMELLEKKREELRQQWEGGAFSDWEPATMALVNCGNIGTCKGFAFVQELTYEQYLGEIDDREHFGTGPQGSSGAD